MNNIKIICTIGPSCDSYEMLKSLIDAGMNIVRLNFSHGSHDYHKKTIENIKRLRLETKKNIGILQDLCGPKIRVGSFPCGSIDLIPGQIIHLIPGGSFSVSNGIPVIPVSYPALIADVEINKHILLDDGLLEAVVSGKSDSALICTVIRGGVLKNNKGVNFPGQVLSQVVPTNKDFIDLEFGVKNNVDFVALSFVQTAGEILRLKSRINELGGKQQVVAKMERDTALENLDSIIDASDAVMVARGDLGIETDIAMVPIFQKRIVRKCNTSGKPVIIATQMLDSMIVNPIPTRAEVTDVANAIYDGSDAIMLSGETAAGKYPVEAVTVMRRIANNVEDNLGLDRSWIRDESLDTKWDVEASVAHSICHSAEELNALWIVANTYSGQTARRISMFRSKIPIAAVTPCLETYYQLSIVWGVFSLYSPYCSTDFYSMINNSEKVLKENNLVVPGDMIVISSGTPESPGGTNLMKVHKVE